jgi:membrane protein
LSYSRCRTINRRGFPAEALLDKLLENRLANSSPNATPSGSSWAALAKRIFTRIKEHDLLGRAAQLSYYFLLALFPLLLFLMTLLGYFAKAGSHLRNILLRYLATVMPGSAVKLLHDTLDEVSSRRGGGKLSFGLVAALWVASKGMRAIGDSLNVAHNVKETRGWWRVRLVSLGLTIAMAVATISALMIVLYGRRIGDAIALSFGYEDSFKLLWRILQWPIALVFVLITFNLILHFAPNLPRRHWRWSTPGGVVAVVLWLLISFGLRLYLHFFDSYSRTYGSLGAMIVLMVWFYLTGLAILIGGEINSELEAGS